MFCAYPSSARGLCSSAYVLPPPEDYWSPKAEIIHDTIFFKASNIAKCQQLKKALKIPGLDGNKQGDTRENDIALSLLFRFWDHQTADGSMLGEIICAETSLEREIEFRASHVSRG